MQKYIEKTNSQNLFRLILNKNFKILIFSRKTFKHLYFYTFN